MADRDLPYDPYIPSGAAQRSAGAPTAQDRTNDKLEEIKKVNLFLPFP
jgi:hypothetical protein